MSSPAGWVAGVDGCRGGWVVVARHRATGEVRVTAVATFAEVLAVRDAPEVIAIDVPIGLADVAIRGGRPPDPAARRLLGRRGVSVFSPPSRPALAAYRDRGDHRHVSAANKASGPDAPGISLQAFGILAKIDEVDRAMTPALQARVREVHPELCFLEAGGAAAVVQGKKSAAGREERQKTMARQGWPECPDYVRTRPRNIDVAADDLMDAYVACWTAARIADGVAIRIPNEPTADAHGLRMEIWR